MKKKVIEFIKEAVFMAVGITLIDFIFYKINLMKSFSISSIIGFMVGWIIVKIIVIMLENKKTKKE